MDIKAAENQIQTVLDSSISNSKQVRVNLNEFSKQLNSTFDVQVQFSGKDYEKPEPNRQKTLVQNTVYRWNILCIWKNLKSHQDCYARFEEIKNALKGLTLTGWEDFSPLYPTQLDFIGMEDNDNYVWSYQFECYGEET